MEMDSIGFCVIVEGSERGLKKLVMQLAIGWSVTVGSCHGRWLEKLEVCYSVMEVRGGFMPLGISSIIGFYRLYMLVVNC